MARKCPVCGFENSCDHSRACEGGCGHIHFGTLVLVAEATGKHTATTDRRTRVGRGLLRSFAGDDARYASEEQFMVYMDAALGCWAVRGTPTARNPTFVNGTPITDATALMNGALISIGKDRLKLKVRIDG